MSRVDLVHEDTYQGGKIPKPALKTKVGGELRVRGWFVETQTKAANPFSNTMSGGELWLSKGLFSRGPSFGGQARSKAEEKYIISAITLIFNNGKH